MNNSRYPTDLTDEQWEYLRPFIPPPKTGGRPRTVNMRAVMNAILYFLCSGCQWRRLPKHFPPWGTVWSYFRKWRIDGTWCQIHSQLYRKMRAAENRAPHPTGAIIDSQSVKPPDRSVSASEQRLWAAFLNVRKPNWDFNDSPDAQAVGSR